AFRDSKIVKDENESPGKRYFARLTLGYGFPVNGDLINTKQTTVEQSSGGGAAYTSVESKTEYIGTYSGGSGIDLSAGAGYMMNNHFGFDLGMNEIISSGLSTKQTARGNTTITDSISSEYGNMFQVNPSIILATKIGGF